MFGFLNVYKPRGLTSHDVVARLRRITKIKQIGHTGTLDPFAEGVLPICIGKATRLIEYLNDDKAYEAIIQLGSSTTTYDLEGEISNKSEKKVDINDVKKALLNFIGDIEQKPPIYSAIKINGKKLYDYARSGQDIELPTRQVTIYKLELLEFNEELQQIKVLIECSKGTYIRSIANDLGETLGTFGHLTKLIRVKAGKFLLEDSIDLDNIDYEKVTNSLIPPLQKLDFKVCEIIEEECSLVKNGMRLKKEGFVNGELIILTKSNSLISIAEFSNNELIQKKVFL